MTLGILYYIILLAHIHPQPMFILCSVQLNGTYPGLFGWLFKFGKAADVGCGVALSWCESNVSGCGLESDWQNLRAHT